MNKEAIKEPFLKLIGISILLYYIFGPITVILQFMNKKKSDKMHRMTLVSSIISVLAVPLTLILWILNIMFSITGYNEDFLMEDDSGM